VSLVVDINVHMPSGVRIPYNWSNSILAAA